MADPSLPPPPIPSDPKQLLATLAAHAAGQVADYRTDSKLKFDSGEFKQATTRWIDAFETAHRAISKKL